MPFLLLALAPFLVPTIQYGHTAPVCDPKSYGARGDGLTKDTTSLQSAIDACARSGGGTVHVHDGVYSTGMIVLRSNIHLRIDATATIRGTQDDNDYPTTNPHTNNSQLSSCRKTLIYAERAQNITIDGGGTLDGNGGKPEWGGSSPERARPMAIYIAQSSNVVIRGISVVNAGMWGVVTLETDRVTVSGLHIHSPFGPTRDGIDIVDCHNVLVENNEIYSEDDSICLKTGTQRGTEDVLVRNNHVLQSSVANGLKLGTASTGSFKNIIFENNVIENVDKAAMAVESVDGAVIQNVQFRQIQFRNAGTGVFVILGKRGNPPAVGSIDGVSFTDVQGTQMRHTWGSAISGTVLNGVTYAPRDISFNNVHITYLGGNTTVHADPPEYAGQYPDPNLWGDLPASGLFVRHVRGLSLIGTTIDLSHPDARPTIVKRDAQ